MNILTAEVGVAVAIVAVIITLIGVILTWKQNCKSNKKDIADEKRQRENEADDLTKDLIIYFKSQSENADYYKDSFDNSLMENLINFIDRYQNEYGKYKERLKKYVGEYNLAIINANNNFTNNDEDEGLFEDVNNSFTSNSMYGHNQYSGIIPDYDDSSKNDIESKARMVLSILEQIKGA